MARQANRPEISDLSRRIEHWRRTRQKLHPMPAELWDAAVAVAGDLGPYATAKYLRINYQSLRAKCGDGAANRRDAPTVSFVELKPPMAIGTTGPVIEFTDVDGRKLTMRFAQGADAELLALARDLWSGAR
jgi:hypothetical protein